MLFVTELLYIFVNMWGGHKSRKVGWDTGGVT